MNGPAPAKDALAKGRRKKGAGRVNPKRVRPFKGKHARESRLPDDYPGDSCFFTVTFYFNEMPPV